MTSMKTPIEESEENIKGALEELRQSLRHDEAKKHPKKKKGKTEKLFEKMLSFKVTVNSVDRIKFNGTLIDFCDDFFVLRNVEVVGIEHTLITPWVIIDRDQISHIHPEGVLKKNI